MGHYKLVLDEACDEVYSLVAIHCSEADYKMAYLLNQHTHMRLHRERTDIDLSKNGLSITFPWFTYEHAQHDIQYHLVANKCKSVEAKMVSGGGLFSTSEEENTRTHYLLPEYKNVDFFLKIQSEDTPPSLRKLLLEINEIRHVISAYSIASEAIKSKNNLIFN
ncbi:IPExxxVDY family protein [Altibacter sp. HG106]|uniref:IPExxxVDY family protein n=1 Tax=Altibacter sp. HG106 TaxID=3023937 RepID=UPI0023506F4F|nr:IPExxxVDY family protein [Altibacter sp. HG106]MDC7994906.1 IPExxxVDY family protein [Altibacter sp. HG106]